MNISRIVALAKEQGKTQAHLCRLLGKSRKYLQDVSSGRFSLSSASLSIIAADIGTTAEYLAWQTDDPAPIDNNAVKIPILGEVAAGIPISEQENILGYEEISREIAANGEYFGFVIKGKSM